MCFATAQRVPRLSEQQVVMIPSIPENLLCHFNTSLATQATRTGLMMSVVDKSARTRHNILINYKYMYTNTKLYLVIYDLIRALIRQ